MKKFLLILFALLTHLSAIAQQQWVLAAESKESTYYVSKTIRQNRGNFIAYEKCVPKNLNAERNRLVNSREDNKYYRYAYMVVTELVDLDMYRTKSLSFAYYDTEGNVLESWDSEDDAWTYAKPETILESICGTIEYLVSKKY